MRETRLIENSRKKIAASINSVISKIYKKSVYGPPPTMEMRANLNMEEVKIFHQNIYNFCDKLFKFFGWCIAVGISIVLWKSTNFGLFIITSIILLFALLTYVISCCIFAFSYIIAKLSEKTTSKITILSTAFLLFVVVGVLVSGAFFAGMNRLVRAQDCSMYNKESVSIPERCRKFVR